MRFEKVSLHEFARWFPNDTQEDIVKAYDNIKLPQRATPGSAGYDFFVPVDYVLRPGVDHMIPTGVKVVLDPGYFLMCVPRSSYGVKYNLRLLNTVGVVDEDFVNGDTEGHIFFPLTADRQIDMCAGDRFMQGIIMKYGVVENDTPIKNERIGGCGSTGG